MQYTTQVLQIHGLATAEPERIDTQHGLLLHLQAIVDITLGAVAEDVQVAPEVMVATAAVDPDRLGAQQAMVQPTLAAAVALVVMEVLAEAVAQVLL